MEDADYVAYLAWKAFMGTGFNRYGSRYDHAAHWLTMHPSLKAYWTKEIERAVDDVRTGVSGLQPLRHGG